MLFELFMIIIKILAISFLIGLVRYFEADFEVVVLTILLMIFFETK